MGEKFYSRLVWDYGDHYSSCNETCSASSAFWRRYSALNFTHKHQHMREVHFWIHLRQIFRKLAITLQDFVKKNCQFGFNKNSAKTLVADIGSCKGQNCAREKINSGLYVSSFPYYESGFFWLSIKLVDCHLWTRYWNLILSKRRRRSWLYG